MSASAANLVQHLRGGDHDLLIGIAGSHCGADVRQVFTVCLDALQESEGGIACQRVIVKEQLVEHPFSVSKVRPADLFEIGITDFHFRVIGAVPAQLRKELDHVGARRA